MLFLIKENQEYKTLDFMKLMNFNEPYINKLLTHLKKKVILNEKDLIKKAIGKC